MSELSDAYFKLKEALAIRELIWSKFPAGGEEAIGAGQFADHKFSLLAGSVPDSLVEARMLLDALDADVGQTGDDTTAMIVKALASYFTGLAAQAEPSSDFESAMLAAGRLARTDLLLNPTSVPIVHATNGSQ